MFYMKIKEFMTTGICSVKPETSIEEAARQMKKIDTGIIPVCNDKEELLGVVTDRDIVVRYLANAQRSPAAPLVSEIMTTQVVSASQDMNIHDAALLLSHHKIKRLPITSGSRLVGILSISDIARIPIMIDEAGDIISAISKH